MHSMIVKIDAEGLTDDTKTSAEDDLPPLPASAAALNADAGFQAIRWQLGMVPLDERDQVRKLLDEAGMELHEDGVWRRRRRSEPSPIAGELG